MSTTTQSTGRYSVGQKLIIITYIRKDGISPLSVLPYLINNSLEKEVAELVLTELTIGTHHKVAWEYDEQKEKKYDGYIAVDKNNNVWHNQYPRAAYEQTSNEGDYAFYKNLDSMNSGESVEDFFKRHGTYDGTLLTHHRDVLKRLSQKDSPYMKSVTKLIEKIDNKLKDEFNLKLEEVPLCKDKPSLSKYTKFILVPAA